ncbi:hypothetical protein L9F63_001145, partial [Diploptera punctata]
FMNIFCMKFSKWVWKCFLYSQYFSQRIIFKFSSLLKLCCSKLMNKNSIYKYNKYFKFINYSFYKFHQLWWFYERSSCHQIFAYGKIKLQQMQTNYMNMRNDVII